MALSSRRAGDPDGHTDTGSIRGTAQRQHCFSTENSFKNPVPMTFPLYLKELQWQVSLQANRQPESRVISKQCPGSAITPKSCVSYQH